MFNFFKKEESKNEKDTEYKGVIKVDLHFISGAIIEVNFDQSDFDNFKITLEKNWNTTSLFNNYVGINFKHVTHYKVKK